MANMRACPLRFSAIADLNHPGVAGDKEKEE
jgi:hypothetical protein